MLKGFIAGVLATIVLELLVAYVGITQGVLIPANADVQSSKMERWAASRSLSATIRREMPTEANPIAATDVNYLAAIKLYERIVRSATASRANGQRRLRSVFTSTRRSWLAMASRTTRTARLIGRSSTEFG